MNIIELFRKDKLTLGIAILMIVFGIAEIITGFRHEFFGLVTTEQLLTTITGAGLGLCYFIGGIFLLTYKKWALSVSFVFLVVDVVGRIIMVLSGMYPVDSGLQVIGIVGGTLIAILFTIFVFIKRKKIE